MYLKQLDILGFKSFANKTTIKFAEGITAIVGPNGCGKTNILDAMRWVLGEQRVSMLRGSKMEEVIFNGTREYKPLGMAEVTFTVINSRGILPTEYNELQITRRLFRSGESEYLLNKVPCRLKDITELFFDTGMGAHSYSVIQQDMIESVISDKAEERRFLFEEAAGITKYKQRKRAAIRKLEATENDFLRLRDIFGEIQTRVRSLHRQQKKAERYQKIVDQIRDWELYLGAVRVNSAALDRREQQAEFDRLNDVVSKKQTDVDTLAAALEGDRKEQVDFEHELTSVGNQVYAASEKAHSLEKEISVLQEKRTAAASLIERNGEEVKALQARQGILGSQIEEEDELLSRKVIQHQTLLAEVSEADKKQAEADGNLMAAREVKQTDSGQLIELEGKLSSGLTEVEGLRRQDEELTALLKELDEQIDTGRTKDKELIDRLETQRLELDQQSEQRTQIEGTIEDRRTETEEANSKIEDLTAEVAEHSAALEGCEARRALLEDMILHYEGYESGVVAAMDVRDRFDGIAGTVAEKFIPTEGMETAVESALGEMAGFIICDQRRVAERIIDYLRVEKKGKIGILVPNSGMLNPLVKRPQITATNFVGWLDSFVETEDDLRPMMQAVLSTVAVYKAGTDPSDILEHLPYGFTAVSPDGSRYSKNLIAGGSDDKFPLFRRKEKVAEQKQMISELSEKIEECNKSKNSHIARIASLRSESATLADSLETINDEIASLKQRLDETGFELRTIETELGRFERERRTALEKREAVRTRQYSLDLDSNVLSDRKANLVSAINASDQRLSDLESQAQSALEKLSSLQVAQVESRSFVTQVETKIAHLKELRSELERTVEEKNGEIARAKDDIASSVARIGELEDNLKRAFSERSEINRRQMELRESQTELLERVSAKEKELKEIRSIRETEAQQLHQIEIRINTLDSELKAITERIADEYDVDIHSIQTTKPDEEIGDDDAGELLVQLKEKLKSFGAVNLLALEEYRTASERELFLGEQMADLETAKKDLEATITKINMTARQLFSETFDKVRVNFQKLFIELFSGGEADITLEDPSDPLESRINITARPAGKKMLSITMMSGGERALTAIALLFSLYMVKPSPFCILDEIDAPLDDANCHRFLRIIRSFSNETQFITITHNKITMEAANNLYGITMEEPGVSKLVAVRFTERSDEETDQDNKIIEVVNKPENDAEPAAQDQANETEPELPPAVVDRITPSVTVSAEDDQQS